jgi:hypothetical protein
MQLSRITALLPQTPQRAGDDEETVSQSTQYIARATGILQNWDAGKLMILDMVFLPGVERESVPFADRIANPSQKRSEGFRHRGPRFLALRFLGIDFGMS